MILLISFRSDIIVPQILLPLKVPQISQINTVFLPSPAIPRRSHPAKHGEGFDAPPTLERSGSEHRRAVTSLALLERARAWEWVKDPPAGEGQVGQKTPLWQRKNRQNQKSTKEFPTNFSKRKKRKSEAS